MVQRTPRRLNAPVLSHVPFEEGVDARRTGYHDVLRGPLRRAFGDAFSFLAFHEYRRSQVGTEHLSCVQGFQIFGKRTMPENVPVVVRGLFVTVRLADFFVIRCL